MRLTTFLCVIGLVCFGGACQPNQAKPQGRGIKPPTEAPLPPPRQPVALDPQLIAAADAEIAQALRSPDPLIRSHGLEAIRDAGATRYNPDIVQALSDSDSRVRFAAALAVGELKLSEAHAKLLSMAEDPSINVRVAVRFALHRLGDTRLSHDLETYAAWTADARVRGNTAMVLGMLGEPSGVKLLKVLRTDAEVPDGVAVRQEASEALWRLGDEDGLKDLVAMTLSKYPDDRIIGYLGLAMPRDTTIRQHVRAGLVSEKDWPEVPLAAARAMGMLGSDEGYVIAQEGAASSDARQRALAALAFGAIGRSDSQEILRKLLADPDDKVRISAATAILQLKPPQ